MKIINWDQYFMAVAKLSALRSKDPSTKVGACIVSVDKRIIGIGYNGMPKGCNDNEFPWTREGDFEETKYPYVVHAEVNAILNSTKSLKNAVLYVSLFPCNECAKMIAQVGIKEIVYASDKFDGTPSNNASKMILKAAGIVWRQVEDFEVSINANW